MRRPNLFAIALVAAVSAVPAAPSARAATCEVNPYQAFLIAQPRGWRFDCGFSPGFRQGALSATLLPEPPDRIGCQWRTQPFPVATPPTGLMQFFRRSDIGLQYGDLRNGWRVQSFEISGGNFTLDQAADIRVLAYVRLARSNHAFRYRLTRLTLHHPTEGCAQVLDRAF